MPLLNYAVHWIVPPSFIFHYQIRRTISYSPNLFSENSCLADKDFEILLYSTGGPYLLCLDFVLLFGGILSLCWRSVPPLLLFCIAVWGITLLCRWSVPPLLDFVLLFDVFIVSDNFCFVNANLHFYLLVFVIIGIFFIKSRKFQKFKKHIFRTPYSCLSVKAGGTRPLLP